MAADAREKPINIKNLVVDEVSYQKPLRFDPERDIPQSDIEGMLGAVDQRGPDHTFYLLLLLPERRNNMRLDDSKFIELRDRFKKAITSEAPESAIYSAAYIKILFPEKFVSINVTEEFAEDCDYKLTEYLQNNRLTEAGVLTEYMALYKLVFPTKNPMFSETKEAQTIIEEGFKLKGESFAQFLANLRITGNPLWKKAAFDEKHWREYDANAENFRSGQAWAILGRLYASMKILAAEKVFVDEEGLHIEMHKEKPLASGVPQLPEVKKY